MPNLELDGLSIKELKNLQTQVAKAISTFEERRRKEALSELEEKARELGFSLSELTGTALTRQRAGAAPKYANPDQPEQTWSGRGRKPHWFVEALAAGKTAEDLQI
ncbi:H-NS histone family protein [Rhodobacter sphaeroides]|jgi:DNA-binding protein H-NS|uniref:Histone-like nucleoid-structuring protein H-NS n=1 Tax=Cereibacter sphaeroides (strain ATCC 17023 / DSM 158 / JCM 6121 / CCUG 31486 / LMG 2827 / NBRC 12203 / NCIMB 8253 / ATH 2.4.1.) TaxID=272943 RepID=Q3IVA3_CERS4|nr:H-NS histone family protein [Cereibacter sphaeroides]ABA81531.1 Histone-like nucleoid-structuring protein H-NS [Cereibacter sphaeroides 2.4.1]AMJ50157.1 transcriptional regulator [Cereibacter sphaeroides]ANS36696.1 transcriptional regulator [Cereibacter sphaeroides]ATN65882.1 transcriptional regulator [Cereibacter sphaeroides]AXC64047.1 H-NS histone family protein [Cereibacter sphaeroides 2.4.1]